LNLQNSNAYGRVVSDPVEGAQYFADLLVVAVKKGTPETRKQVMNAVVVRQRRPFRRPEGMMVQFEDNACVIVTPEGEVKGSDIKGPVAREAAERWPRVAATASMIV